MVTIAVDAMGGDFAPGEVLKGTRQAANELPGTEFILAGVQATLEKELSKFGGVSNSVRTVNASHHVEMEESPVEALKKKPGTSIAVAVQQVKQGKADAVVSAGNTGAAVAACYMGLGSLKGVRRPGIAITFLLHSRPVVLMDAGANVHCRPEDLVSYAYMASLYAEQVLGVKDPRVGLLNVGKEEAKGSRFLKAAGTLLQRSKLRYVGNVEGDKIFSGTCDVIVCEGFVGNTVLKVSESVSENVLKSFIQELRESAGNHIDPSLLTSSLERFRRRVDYADQGGAPLLGINGTCIICHGRSHAKAISNALRCAARMVEKDMNRQIQSCLAANTPVSSEVRQAKR